MNWSRTKTWFIVLFLGINIFLIYTLAHESVAASIISDDVIDSTVSVLKKNSVTIDKNIIPNKMPSLCALVVKNTFESEENGAKMLLGEGYRKTEEGYANGSKTFYISGDEFSFFDSDPTPISNFTYTNAEKTALDELSRLGFDLSNAALTSVYQDENHVTVKAQQRLDSYPLVDSSLTITLSAGGIESIQGSCFSLSDDQSEAGAPVKIKDSTSMLIDFMARSEAAGTTITGISIGYITGDKSTFHKTATAYPVWQITTSAGDVYYEDAN